MQSDSSENDMEQNQTNIKAGEPQSQHQQLNEQETAPKVKSDQEELQSETLSFNIEEETDEEESEKSHSTIDVEGGDQTTIANTDQLKDAQDMDKPQLHDTRQVPEQKLKKFEEGLLASFIQQYEKPFKGMKEAFTYYKQYKIDNDGKTKLNLPILAKQCDLTSEHCKNLFMNTEAKYLDKWDQKTKDQVSERLTELWNQPHVESNKDYKVKIKEQVLEEFKIRQQVAKNYREMKSHIHYKMKQLEKQVPLDPKDSIEHLQENNENDSKPEANQQNEDKKQTVLNEKLPTLNFKTIQKTETVEILDTKIQNSNNWYFILNGKIKGPFTTKQMNTWNSTGDLPLDLFVQRGSYAFLLQNSDRNINNFFKDVIDDTIKTKNEGKKLIPNVTKEKNHGKKLISSNIQEKQRNNLIEEQQISQPITVGTLTKQPKNNIQPNSSQNYIQDSNKSKDNQTQKPTIAQSMRDRDQYSNNQLPSNQPETYQYEQNSEPLQRYIELSEISVYESIPNEQPLKNQVYTTHFLSNREPTDNHNFENNLRPPEEIFYTNDQQKAELEFQLLKRYQILYKYEFTSLQEAIDLMIRANEFKIIQQGLIDVQNYLMNFQGMNLQECQILIVNLEREYGIKQQVIQNLNNVQTQLKVIQQNLVNIQPQVSTNVGETETNTQSTQEKENKVRDAYRDKFKNQNLTMVEVLVKRKQEIYQNGKKILIDYNSLEIDENYIDFLEHKYLKSRTKQELKIIEQEIKDTYNQQKLLLGNQKQELIISTKSIIEKKYKQQFEYYYKQISNKLRYDLNKLQSDQ
ncbi:GYF_domain [Hexamita inflata]|uniref:GYF domain n=1 Tax=Hexamita inflata TaxID=28002 RepID=A0AA86UE98_9EUKA|nr:GYF domain [Hexamita inflata]